MKKDQENQRQVCPDGCLSSVSSTSNMADNPLQKKEVQNLLNLGLWEGLILLAGFGLLM